MPKISSTSTNPAAREQRKFFCLVGATLIAAGAWKIHRQRLTPGEVLVAAGASLLVLEFALNAIAQRVFAAWMAFARILGAVNAAIIVSVIYFLLLTPIGLFARRKSRAEAESLRRKKSAWIPLEESTIAPGRYLSPY